MTSLSVYLTTHRAAMNQSRKSVISPMTVLTKEISAILREARPRNMTGTPFADSPFAAVAKDLATASRPFPLLTHSPPLPASSS